jgi:hypothetical protein
VRWFDAFMCWWDTVPEYTSNIPTVPSVGNAISSIGDVSSSTFGITHELLKTQTRSVKAGWNRFSALIPDRTGDNFYFNNAAKHPRLTKATNVTSGIIIRGILVVDIGHIWTADNGRTYGQRVTDTVLSLGRTAFDISVSSSLTGACKSVLGVGVLPVAIVAVGCIIVNHIADYTITRGCEIAQNGRYNFDEIWEAAGETV